MKRANPVLGQRAAIALFSVLVLLFILALSGAGIHLVTESWWFESVGYPAIFWTRIRWQVLIWLVTLVGYAAFLYGHYRLAVWLTRDAGWRLLHRYKMSQLAPWLPHYSAIAIVLLVALNGATENALLWDKFLQFINPTTFDRLDPLFQQDISFYVFQLPIYQAVQTIALRLVLWALMLALAVYLLKGEIRPERGWQYFLTGSVKTHLCGLLAVLALIVSAGFYLGRYELLFSPDGVVFGAGYTDVHARLHAHWTMAFVTLAVAALFILALWRSGFILPTIGIAMYGVVLLAVSGLYPWFQQKFLVEPNELVREKPYIEHNIAFTREAYALDAVERAPFPVEEALTRQVLENNSSTIDNIRLWDYRPLLSTYRQLQEIRLYYRFQDVDIDRYTLNGDYRQVMLSARELDYTEAPAEAQTWVNQRLKFTHGYGIVMSPVNQVTPDGLPELVIKNVPPVSSVDLAIEEPRIYYGEATDSYIFTGTTTDEFDYPDGNNNTLYRYDGAGGVPLTSLLRRLAYAYDLNSLKVLISNYITGESKVHYHRRVLDRVRQIAPFLTYDSDPYMTVVNGRLQWVIDAYSMSDRYPYSAPIGRSNDVAGLLNSQGLIDLVRGGTNYIRDAAKVTVDAYDGTVSFYVIDESDPILGTYRKIFPTLFKATDEIPADVFAHFRYPNDFFIAQAQMYRTYHMSNPEVFYNREDLWRFPTQVYEQEQVRMDPYYTIMRLPDAETEEFVQILPFTPINKDNMVAWMAGRSDGEDYGKLLLYEFPKQKLVFGPGQIEARIDQTPEFSEQRTLLGQQGSRLIRGDLLVLPIERSLLYVEPIYLQAEQGELPELKRVIVAYGNDVVIRETLEESLAVIFGDSTPIPAAVSPEPVPADVAANLASRPELSETLAAQIQAALDAYETGRLALQQSDWEAYGQSQAELEAILRRLNQDL